MALHGLGKLIGGKEVWTMVGNMPLDLIGLGGKAAGLALVLGLLVALVELLGGISFAGKCPKTSKYAAMALTVIMGVAVIVMFK